MQHQTSQPPPQPPPSRPPQLSMEILIGMGVIILALWYFSSKGNQTKIPKGMPMAREATKKEIKAGIRKAKRQRAVHDIGESAVRLNPETGLMLASINPGGCIPGLSGRGKTTNAIIPILESHAEDGDTLLICDIKGDLMRDTAAYLHSLGYKLYFFAPGIEMSSKNSVEPVQFTGGINLLDFLNSDDDTDGTLAITRGINVNAAESLEKRHQYFGPQGDLIQETAMLISKGTMCDDMLMVWELMGLNKLAERLQAAYEHGQMNGIDLPYYAGHKSRGLRAVAKDKGSGNPGPTIQSTASQTFGKFIGPKISRCLTQTTIPLDLKGKTAVYFQIDEDAIESTAPLVATAMHMLIKRNISNRRKRDNHLVLIADEASRYPLPDLPGWASLSRSNGFVAWLAYQQETQMQRVYQEKRWAEISSNLPTKIYFNQGDEKSNEIVAKALGKKTIVAATASQSQTYGSNSSTSKNDKFEQVDLLSGSELGKMLGRGTCVIVCEGFGAHPIIYKDKPIPYQIEGPLAEERDRRQQEWFDVLLPALQQEHEQLFGSINIQEKLSARTDLAETLLPLPEDYEANEIAEELANAV